MTRRPGPARRGHPLVDASRAAGVVDSRVLDAIAAVPRERYVPAEHADEAHRDRPIPIASGQVTTQPSLVARMVEALQLQGDERVLEIGTGLGYQAAVLVQLCARVFTVERHADLAEQARANLTVAGIDRVEIHVGDGTVGLPDQAPFDAMVVAAASPQVPAPLVEQLAVGGRLVQPIGPGGHEQVTRFERTAEGLQEHGFVTGARFVPLVDDHGDEP